MFLSNLYYFVDDQQIDKMIGGLSTMHLLCTDIEGCHQFVEAGVMQHLVGILQHDLGRSTATSLMVLGVIERACRYAVGCEALLGWFPREGGNVPNGASEGYSTLLRLLLQRQRHDIACLTSHILHRLRAYEIIIVFEVLFCSSEARFNLVSATSHMTDPLFTCMCSLQCGPFWKILQLMIQTQA